MHIQRLYKLTDVLYPMQRHPFGSLPTGELVQAFTLKNDAGASLQVITLGGIVTSLCVPDRHGQVADVVLGFDNLERYLAPHPYIGAIAGRVAGRINRSRFVLDGRAYELAPNDPPNHLHGGWSGFDRRLWSAIPLSRVDGADSLRLAYRSPDGEEGYPGTVNVTVIYTLTADNAFVIETEATTDRATPFSLTQHSYFNLAGEGMGTIEGHELQIHAEAYAPTDERMALLGRRVPLAGQGNDFNHPRRIGDALPHLFQAHGDLYFLSRSGADKSSEKALRLAARVFEPASGRVLTVSTTEDCLQLYTGVLLDGSLIGKSGQPYGPHAGLCLECESYPDGANTPALGNIILRPGQLLRHTTVYAFSTH
ncbi:MAG: galactose mutarotase [Methylacidiphilales bacterium]|nr:galactose mutarotase [Candidatus Methylacidiphilales bacterium]